MRLVPFTEYFLKLLAATVFYTFSSRMLLNYFAPDDSVSIFFIASGVALATVLIGGSRYALSIFFGSTLSNSLGGLPIVTAMVMGMGSTLGATLAADWLTRYRRLDLSLTSLSDWLKLMLWGGCFGCSINAVIGSTALLLTGVIGTDSYLNKITHWWMGDALGVFIVTPFILTVWQARKLAINPKQLAEALLIIGLSFLVGQVVFLGWFHNYLGQIANSYWMFLLITWIALRLNTQWMTLFMVMTAIQALQGVYSELGIINNDIVENKALNYWLYLIALSCVGITLSTFITTHRHTQAQKQEALDRLEKIASRLPGMVYSFRLAANGDMSFPYSSTTIQTIYRVSPEEVQRDGAKIFAILHPDDYEQVIASIKLSAQNLTAWQQEYRTRFEDGTVRWLYGNALPQREEDGATLWYGFITDITESKQIQVAEQQQHTLTLNVINSLSHPFYVVNTDDYSVQLANQSAGPWLKGITTCYQLSHKKDSPCASCTTGKHPCPLEEVKLTKKPTVVEHIHYDKNGSPRIVEVFAYPIFDATGEVHQIIEYVIDITDRKQIQNEILATKNELQATLNAIPDLLFELDLNGRYHNFHAPRTELLAASPEQFLGKTVAEILPPDAAEICFSALQEAHQQGWSTGKQIKLELNKNTHWFELSVAVKQTNNEQQPHFIVLSRDITDRKLSEIAIAESQKLLRTIIDTVPLRVFWKDCNLYYLGCNKLFTEDAGMADPNDIVGKNDYQMGWAEQAELYRADDRTVMESGIAKLSYDEPQTTPSGETIWLRTSKVPLKNQHDEIIGLLGVYEDITERKRVEQQLFDSEAFTNSVLNSLASHIAVLDAQGMIIAVNNAWKQFAETNGLPEINHAMLGADYLAVCQKAFNQPNGEEANAVQYGISSVLAGDSDRFHLEYPCHSPTQQRWFYMTVSPLKGGQQGVVISHENITQRKQMEEALKASEARFRSIIDASPVPMALNDEQGNINYLNAAFVQTFGYDVTDIPTLPDWWTKAYPDPAYRLWVADTWQAALDMAEREHQPFAPQELNIYCKNGTQKTVLVSATAISESFHSLHLVVLYDITERKQAEAELKRSNAELEQFAYAVSHDMRQPLRMVTSYLSLIETALAPQLDEETQQFLTFALEGAKRMDAMILSLLDYSRVGRRTKPLALISSRAAVDEALAFLEPDTKASGGHIEVTGDWVELYASRDELTRLLQNLIGNALKYHEENKPPYVEVRATVTANTFKVAVRDSGIGIDPSQIDRLFKVFSRLQMRTRFEGTGVGLALCRKIVEHHGGQIGVESAGEGQGSVFWFELPLSQSSHTRET